MKDEIKEMNFSEMLFNRDERLLDYITNLQEQVKGIREERDYLFNKLSTENKYLQEKNERLTRFKYNILNDKTKSVPTITKSYKNEYETYKSRNEKAVEYIKEHPTQTWYSVEKPNNDFREVKIIEHQKVLLDILQGSDKE